MARPTFTALESASAPPTRCTRPGTGSSAPTAACWASSRYAPRVAAAACSSSSSTSSSSSSPSSSSFLILLLLIVGVILSVQSRVPAFVVPSPCPPSRSRWRCPGHGVSRRPLRSSPAPVATTTAPGAAPRGMLLPALRHVRLQHACSRVSRLSQISPARRPAAAGARTHRSAGLLHASSGVASAMSLTMTRSNSPSANGHGRRRMSCCTKRHRMSLSGLPSAWRCLLLLPLLLLLLLL